LRRSLAHPPKLFSNWLLNLADSDKFLMELLDQCAILLVPIHGVYQLSFLVANVVNILFSSEIEKVKNAFDSWGYRSTRI
jgi:hypothetical protein